MSNDYKHIRLPNGRIVGADEEPDSRPAIEPAFLYGGCAQVPCLPDVSNNSNIIRRDWSKTAPDWRVAGNGLNIEGRCKTKSCTAYNQGRVIFKYGFRNDGVFDYFKHERQVTCPMCHGYVDTENFGLCSTWYKVEGHKKPNKAAIFSSIHLPWKYVGGDKYTTFHDAIGNLVDWGRLVITVQQHRPKGVPV